MKRRCGFLSGTILICVFSLFFLQCESSEQFRLPGVVSVEGGDISGSPVEGSGVVVFKGIPYAAPPVGAAAGRAMARSKILRGFRAQRNPVATRAIHVLEYRIHHRYV